MNTKTNETRAHLNIDYSSSIRIDWLCTEMTLWCAIKKWSNISPCTVM